MRCSEMFRAGALTRWVLVMAMGSSLAQLACAEDAPAAAAAPATQPSGPAPKLKIDQPEFNFGERWSGETIKHEFIIRNEGDAVLEITKVQPSCGCTVAGEYDKKIEPGQEGRIPLALNTARQHSQVNKQITVESNDPANPKVFLFFKGNLKMRVKMDPVTGAAWNVFLPGQPETKTVTITNYTDKPMKLELAPDAEQQPTPGREAFDVSVKNAEDGKSAEITVSLRKPLREGMSFATFKFKTNLEEEPEITVPANVQLRPPVFVTPAQIFAMLQPGQEWVSNLTVQYTREGTMKVENVTASDPAIKTILSTIQEGRQYSIAVTVPKDFKPPAPGEKPVEIVIQTDLAENGTVRVPMQFRTPATQPTVTAESMVGKPAPVASLLDLDGKSVQIGGATNKVQIINFWASWCPYCKREMPKLEQVRQKYDGKDVTFLAISVDRQLSTEKLREAVQQLGYKGQILVDSGNSVAPRYGGTRLPTLFFVSKQGVIEGFMRGDGGTTFEEEVSKKIDLLLEGKPLPRTVASNTPAQPAQTQPATPPVKGPSLGVESRIDVGPRKPREKVEYNFTVRNSGSEPLQVKSAKGSEGLKISAEAARSVAPGGSAVIRVEFTAPDKPGPASHTVTLETNDPAKASQTITLNTTVRPYVEVQPATGVRFPRNPRTLSIPSLATLVYNGEGEITYEKPVSSSPKFEAKIDPILNGPYSKLIVTALPPFDEGEHAATLTIKTSCKEQPELIVPVELYVPPRIEVTPKEITVSATPRLQRSMVTIRNNGETSLSMLRVTTSNPKIRWQFYPESDGLSYKLMVILPAPEGPENKSFAGEKITVHTDDGEFAKIEIPIVDAAATPTPAGISSTK